MEERHDRAHWINNVPPIIVTKLRKIVTLSLCKIVETDCLLIKVEIELQ